jgi:uncharacterized protein (AIM24 family)
VAPSPIPGVTEFAFGRLLNPGRDTPTLSLTVDGHLMITVRGEMMTRTDAVLLSSENFDVRAVNRRMQGRAVPEVFQRLVSLEGEGHLVLSRETEKFLALQLQRDLCFFVEHYIWAVESTLMWDVGQLPRSGRSIQLVRVAGEGAVAVRVPGELVAVKIAPERPYRVHRSGFVGWVGNVVPYLEPAGDFLHCEGEGAVFVVLPSAGAPPFGSTAAGRGTMARRPAEDAQ